MTHSDDAQFFPVPSKQTEEKIVSVAVPRPLPGFFTYRVPPDLGEKVCIGSRVKVPFGSTFVHAFVVAILQSVSEIPEGLSLSQVKEILEVDDESDLLPKDVWSLCNWAHDYYCTPLGEVLGCASFRSKKLGKPRALTLVDQPAQNHPLTPDQKKVFENLNQLRMLREGRVALLFGVTGSGKTEVYIELAKETLQSGKSVLILVPEIALTPQLHQRFEKGLGKSVGLWHSAMSPAKRRDYCVALKTGQLKVLIGARSAVFAPILDLGLLVVDEEHDPTYKQEDRVRYHARDLAIVRAKLTQSFVVLGSATPSLETRERVREKKYSLEQLHHRIAPGGLPQIQVIDLKEEVRIEEIQTPLAQRTLQQIQEVISAGEQVIIYLNRRGYAAFLLCKGCGAVKRCPRCSVTLTVYKKNAALRCHLCGWKEKIPKQCPKCEGVDLYAMGSGTEGLETEITSLLNGAKISRLDRDQITSVSKLQNVLDHFRSGKSNILLGTQMLVKGHDFPGVTLVVVVLADALFRWPDFRTSERAFQILKQVSGRAGRGEKQGRVLIQTFDPEHSVIQVMEGKVEEDVFIESERELRQSLGYPPWGRLARIRFENYSKEEAKKRAAAVVQNIELSMADAISATNSTLKTLEVLGPSEAFLEKVKNTYRWDILLKAKNIQTLQRAVNFIRSFCLKNKWHFLVDIDPYGI